MADLGAEAEPEPMAADAPALLRSELAPLAAAGRVKKGRGFTGANADRPFAEFESLEPAGAPGAAAGPARSVEGWILLVRGVHEEAAEDDVHDAFAEHGEVVAVALPLDRRTGFVKASTAPLVVPALC